MISPATRVLLRSLLKPFYRENGGLILFLLFIMFAAVGHNNGVGLREYHHQLILGMLRRTDLLLIVVFAWILYALRGISLVSRVLQDPAFSFLCEYARLSRGILYRRLLLLQFLLFIPVLSYSGIILVIAWLLHLTGRVAGICAILAALTFGVAAWYSILFSDPALSDRKIPGRRAGTQRPVRYWQLLFRFVVTEKKTLLVFIKFFSVTMLWGILCSLFPGDEDLRMPVLFYGFGLFGHSVLLFQCREMEEKGLNFYRGLPVSLLQRFAAYAIFYGLIFLPETVVLIGMTPKHISLRTALLLFAMGYGILMLLNSVLFTRSFTKTAFLKICCGIYLFIFTGVLSGILPLVVAGITVVAVWLFLRFYYRFEPAPV